MVNVKVVKRVLTIAGAVLSIAGMVVEPLVQQANTQDAVNKYMDNYMKQAMKMATEQNKIEDHSNQ